MKGHKQWRDVNKEDIQSVASALLITKECSCALAKWKDVSSCEQHAHQGGKITPHQLGDVGQIRQKTQIVGLWT